MVEKETLHHATFAEIQQCHATLYKTFRAGTCRPLEYRRAQLLQLARMMQDNAEALAGAIHKDLGKPKQEALAMEVGTIVERSLICAESLKEWSKPQSMVGPDWQKSWSPKVFPTPKGPVLIIAPWNYPLILSLQALYAAIAAGCPAVVKPSEFAPAYSELLATLVPKYLDSSAYVVIRGAVEETTKLLELKWAHIFYTGNGRVGRIIAMAAAKHLTPVSLELGGKSPVIIDPNYDINLAAKRILWGKCANAGQTCVAPDYIIITKDKKDELLQAIRTVLHDFYPDSEFASDSFGRIVSTTHFQRLKGLLAKSKGTVVIGGKVDEQKLKFGVTVITDVDREDVVMQEEIFGPILPIITVSNLDEAIDFVNAGDNPLTFYAFTEDPAKKQRLLDETLSGSLIFNDTLNQVAVHELPFSGVGESGYGAQVLKYGYDGFTHLRSTLDIPKEAEPFMSVRYPPYNDKKIEVMAAAVHLPIPAQ